MHDFKRYKERLNQLEQQLAGAHHRQLVIITGNAAWCYALLNLLKNSDDALTLSKHCELRNAHWPDHTHQILGQEFTHAVYDGFSGLHPDKLAALAGTVKAGGVLFLLLPELNNLATWQDPALNSVRSHGYSNRYSLFNQRFATIIEKLSTLHFSEKNGCKNNDYSNAQHNQINFEPQKNCVEQIVKCADGRANRPLLINADRGRGKSAALGLAAAKLTNKKVVICATQFSATHNSFKYLASELNLSYDPTQKQLANLHYFAPDVLLNELPECELLLVDEAAAIPVPLLLKMLSHYPRIVFSSTLVGYEGNGRGYSIRFSKYIKANYKASKVITLNEPLRFAKHDPLEHHIRTLLALDAHYLETNSNNLSNPSHTEITQRQLATSEPLLQQVIALLALAHYQSSANDLRQLLDASSQRIFISQVNNKLVGVCLIAIEGGLNIEIAEQVVKGERRPQGHLMAQTLSQISFRSDFLTHLSARVVRITVDPSSHSCGLGKKLLTYCEARVKEHCDWLGASFGATAQLLKFWQKQGFNAVKLGYHRDKSTAEHSVLVIKSLIDNQRTTKTFVDRFKHDFFYGLITHFKTLDWELVDSLIKLFNDEKINTDAITLFRLQEKKGADRFTISPIMWRIINNSPSYLSHLPKNDRQLLIQAILQNYTSKQMIKQLSLSGKKQFDKHFKNATHELAKYI
jgi:tRNA(Met) cytidine acetyltransferase